MEKESNFVLSNSWLFLPVGILLGVRISVSLWISLKYFWNAHVKVRFLPAEKLQKKYGQWAVVTGCTSGIGEHFVHELASLGMDIVLISRSFDKLNKQATQTEKQYGVKTKIIAVDFLNRDAYKFVVNEIQGMDIGLLVNNVGLNTDTGSRNYREMTTEEVRNMIVVNCGACTLMSKCFLPAMIARGKGCVLNVGSTSGFISLPYQALYSATKSYKRMISLSTDDEISSKGVSIRCSIPQFIRTGMCKGNSIIYNIPFWTCDPRVYVSNTIMTLDTPDTGGWWFFDLIIWCRKIVMALLHRDIEEPLYYWTGSPLVTMSSIVQE